MNVLSVLHYPVFGGPHNRNAKVGAILSSQGVDTLLLLPFDAIEAASRVEKAGCKTLRIPLTRLRKTFHPAKYVRFIHAFRRNIIEIRRIIRKNDIDVVVINGLMNPHAAIAAAREGVPVVWQILDSFPPAIIRRIMRPLLKRYASVIMCTGARVACDHLGKHNLDKPVVLFYPPVDLERFNPQPRIREAARAELGFCKSDVVVGNVANVNPMKGHLTFVRAAAAARKVNQNLRFVIFGQTYENHKLYMERLMMEASKLGLRLGKDWQIVNPKMRVSELAQALDIYWLTSEPRSEGISTSAEEAMTLGLPVISTETGSMDEIVRHGENGFMVAPYDVESICHYTLALVKDSSLRDKMGDAARRFALDHFAAEKCAALHLRAYRIAQGDSEDVSGVQVVP